MKNTPVLYKIAILLAIGAGIISVTQNHELRSQLRESRETLLVYENQGVLLHKDSLLKAYDNGYKDCLVDIYNNTPKYIITVSDDKKTLNIWKQKEKRVHETKGE
jgi:isocitrate dehydrogenase